MIYPIYRTNNPVSNDYDPSLPIGFGWWEGEDEPCEEKQEDNDEPEEDDIEFMD